MPVSTAMTPAGTSFVKKVIPLDLYTQVQIDDAVARVQAEYTYPICGFAKISQHDFKSLDICKLRAGRGTKHQNSGKCSYHGGNSGAPIKHGLYSKYLSNFPTLQDMFEDFRERNQDQKDLSEEINLLRTVLGRILDEMQDPATMAEDVDKALERAKQVRAIGHILEITEQIRKLVESKHEIEETNKIVLTFESFSALLWQFQNIITQEVDNKDAQGKIFDRFSNEIRLLGAANAK